MIVVLFLLLSRLNKKAKTKTMSVVARQESRLSRAAEWLARQEDLRLIPDLARLIACFAMIEKAAWDTEIEKGLADAGCANYDYCAKTDGHRARAHQKTQLVMSPQIDPKKVKLFSVTIRIVEHKGYHFGFGTDYKKYLFQSVVGLQHDAKVFSDVIDRLRYESIGADFDTEGQQTHEFKDLTAKLDTEKTELWFETESDGDTVKSKVAPWPEMKEADFIYCGLDLVKTPIEVIIIDSRIEYY